MFSAYTIKKMLPRLIIAVIAVNLSWYLAIGMLNIANVLGGATREILLAPFSGFSTDVIGTLSGGQQGVVAAILGAGGIAILFSSFAIFTPILVGGLIALFIGYVALVLRQAFLVMLIVLSPILIALWVIPGMENVSKKAMSLFMKLLIMYPVIMALLISGRIVSAVLNTGSDTELLPKVIAMVALFAPYFMIPFALKFVGGALASISNMANDRSRGLIDGLRKRGSQKAANNRSSIAAGNRFKGGKVDSDGKSRNLRQRLNRGLQNTTLASQAGFRPSRMRAGIAVARNERMMASAEELLEKNQTLKNFISDDDKLWAVTNGGNTAEGIRKQLLHRAPGRFTESDPVTLDNAVAEVMKFKREAPGQAGLVAAAIAQAGTGTGYNYSSRDDVDDDMYNTIARVSGGDRNIAGQMLGKMRPMLKNSGRMEFAGGYAKTATILGNRMDAIASGNDTIEVGGQRVKYDADTAMRETARDAWQSNGGAFIAGKKRTIEMAAPAIVDDIEASSSSTMDDHMFEMASLSSKYDAASAVAPQNAKVLRDQVLNKGVRLDAMTPEVREFYAPVVQAMKAENERNGIDAEVIAIPIQRAMEFSRKDGRFQGVRREIGRSAEEQANQELLRQQLGGVDGTNNATGGVARL